MSPRRLRHLSAWLLPFLAARLLVPAGFMLTMTDAGLDVVLCAGMGPAATARAAATSNSGHADHHAHAGTGHAPLVDAAASSSGPEPADHARHADTVCPFALAGTVAVTTTLKSDPVPPQLAAHPPRLSADPAWIAPAVLIDRIRGPPLA